MGFGSPERRQPSRGQTYLQIPEVPSPQREVVQQILGTLTMDVRQLTPQWAEPSFDVVHVEEDVIELISDVPLRELVIDRQGRV